MAELDELELIMAKLADQASTSMSTTSSIVTTTSAATHVFSSSYQQQQQNNNINNNNNQQTGEQNEDEDDDDDDALSALRKGPNRSSSTLFSATTQEQESNTKNNQQKYAADVIFSRVLENERKIQILSENNNNDAGSSSFSNNNNNFFSTSTLDGELHLTSRCHNLLSDPDRIARLEKWKTLCGGSLNNANLTTSAGNATTDLHDPVSLARFAENFLEAWTLDSDSFLLRRARSILVGEMLFLMELERDEGRSRKQVNPDRDGNTGNNNNNSNNNNNIITSINSITNALFGSSNSNNTNNKNKADDAIAAELRNQQEQSQKREKIIQVLQKQKSFQDSQSQSSNLPPPRTLSFTPSSRTAQECLRLIHYDRFASNEKWLILLKEIKTLPLAKVRHIWQYAIKTFPSTTWLVVDYLTLEIEAEKQVFEQVKENQENNLKNNNNSNNGGRANENNEEEWLAVLTARLRILDTFEAHLRVCVGSAQLHALFMQYLSQAVVGVDSATKLSIAKRCLQEAGRCFDAYSLWKEVLKTRVGLLDEANVVESRKIFHRLLETPLDNLEQAKAEYLSFENRVSTSAASYGGGAPIAESLPPQLNQLYRTAYDEFGDRRRHWDVVAQRQRWLGNLALRSSQEQIRLQVQQKLASQQGSTAIAGTGKNLLKTLGASSAEQQLTALQQKTLSSMKASKLGGSSMASVTLTLGQDEGKIPAAEAEKAIANSLPTSFMPRHPGSVLNLSKMDGEGTTAMNAASSSAFQDDEEFQFYLRKKLVEIQHAKDDGNDSNNNNDLYDEYEELIDYLFNDENTNGARKTKRRNNQSSKNDSFLSPFQGFTNSASTFRRQNSSFSNKDDDDKVFGDVEHEDDDDNLLFDEDDDETNQDQDNQNSYNKNSSGFFGLSASMGNNNNNTSSLSSSSSSLLRRNKLLRHSLFSTKNLIKQRLQALETGNRILAFHSAWDALIEIETDALKRILDSANNNNSNSSSNTNNSSSSSTILSLINTASPSRDVLMQIASRCRKVSFLWEQRCRSEPCIASNWLMWARSRIEFFAAKVKMSNDTLSDDDRRKDVEQVCAIFVEAVSRFPDNLVLANSFADFLTSYGDAKSANEIFFSLSQQCVAQAKLLFLYEQEATMELKNISAVAAADSNNNSNNNSLQQHQQLQRIQAQRIQTLLQLLRSRNLQTFCQVEFSTVNNNKNNNHNKNQEELEHNNNNNLDQDSASVPNHTSDEENNNNNSIQHKLMSMKQYPLPLCWRFCDRPRFSDTVVASVLACPYEPASISLLRHCITSPSSSANGQKNKLTTDESQEKSNNFLRQVSSRLSTLRNQIKDNITLGVVSWMKWALRSKNTRYWSQSVSGFSEVSSANLALVQQQQQQIQQQQSEQASSLPSASPSSVAAIDTSLLHLRTVARYAVSACGIGRHPLFLHAWANLEAGCGSQEAAAQAVQLIAQSWKKNILNAITVAATKFRTQMSKNISVNDMLKSSSPSDPVRKCLVEISQVVTASIFTASTSSSFLKQCGADELFFDTLRTLDLLASSVRSSSANNASSVIFYENAFRQEIADFIIHEFFDDQNQLKNFISTFASSQESLSELVLHTLRNFASNSNAENRSKLRSFDDINNDSSASSLNLGLIDIVKSTSPALYQFLFEIRKLFTDASSYRSMRLRCNNNNYNTSSFLDFAQLALSSASQGKKNRSTMNFGEVVVRNESRDDSDSDDDDDNIDEELFFSDRVNHESGASTSSTSSKPNFNFFTKIVDGGSGKYSRGIKLSATNNNAKHDDDGDAQDENDNDDDKKRKKKDKLFKKKSQHSSPAHSSAAASPLQFILPHLAHKQLPASVAAAAASSLKNSNNNKNSFDARQLHRQKMEQQQKEMIQSALSSRGPTDFYTTSLIDSHRKNSAWGWEAVLMKLISTGGTGVAGTKAEKDKSVKARADEEDLAVFKSTLPVYQKSRVQNTSLMNAVLSRQADRDADALLADLAWQNEINFPSLNNNNSDDAEFVSSSKALVQKLLSSCGGNNNQQQNPNSAANQADSVHSVVRNRCQSQSQVDDDDNALPQSSFSQTQKEELSDNLLLQMLVTEKMSNQENIPLPSDSVEASAAAWDKFAGKFSSNALFRLIHRLPSSHGLGYKPAYRFRNNLITATLKKKKNNEHDDDDDEDDEQEEFDFVKSTVHRTTATKQKQNTAFKTEGNDGTSETQMQQNDDDDEDQDNEVNFYPTTRFVMETLMTKRLN